MSTNEPAYLTREQVAEHLQLTAKTLANWASRGVGPNYIRLGGGRVRYPRKDFEAWEQSQLGDD
ncbi:helix-turn-helix transcriptional regulator [Nocardia jiangxiensis]|uniref:helix-turn-helix transcriptional regulator n=1 Tax=Nocardia jiangxiensis TaxID=282685 RepID=UPI0002EF472F|nr:helix-turn-helix domain-containing protein [Nocardia jiangxiensis]